jgi:hypothetical protein
MHVQAVMPAETHPITDPARLAAEDAEQSRELYRALLQQHKAPQQQQGSGWHATAVSANALAHNMCSSVAFSTGVSATAEAAAQRTQQLQLQQQLLQQQQQQQQQEAADKQAAAAAAAEQEAAAAEAAAGKGSKQAANKLATLWSKAPAKKVRQPQSRLVMIFCVLRMQAASRV